MIHVCEALSRDPQNQRISYSKSFFQIYARYNTTPSHRIAVCYWWNWGSVFVCPACRSSDSFVPPRPPPPPGHCFSAFRRLNWPMPKSFEKLRFWVRRDELKMIEVLLYNVRKIIERLSLLLLRLKMNIDLYETRSFCVRENWRKAVTESRVFRHKGEALRRLCTHCDRANSRGSQFLGHGTPRWNKGAANGPTAPLSLSINNDLRSPPFIVHPRVKHSPFSSARQMPI